MYLYRYFFVEYCYRINEEVIIIEKRGVTMVIERFNGEYSFLSNFYESQITYDDITYRNNESAFQAQKDLSRREEFVNLTGYESRKLGRKVNLRKDWDEVKFKIMEDIVRLKFSQNEELKSKLLKLVMLF